MIPKQRDLAADARLILPSAVECVLAGARDSQNGAVAAWLREDREGSWVASAQELLDKISHDQAKSAMALKIGSAAVAKEVGVLLRLQALHAMMAALKKEEARVTSALSVPK